MDELFELGHKNASCDSARLLMADAIALFHLGRKREVKQRILKALAFSVGVFSPVYLRAASLAEKV
jgi:hypothetical protein